MDDIDTQHALHPTERVFLGLATPAIDTAADWLVERFGCELSRLRIVTQGRRSQRLLLGELVDRASERERPLEPPTLLTPGAFVERVAGHLADREGLRLAGPLAQRLIWQRAVESLDAPLRAALSRSGEHANPRLASLVRRSVETLAHNRLDAHKAMAVLAERDDLPSERWAERWAAIAAATDHARAGFDALGLAEPAALLHDRLAQGWTPDSQETLVLLGIGELSRLERHVVFVSCARPAVLIVAEPSDHDRFDDLGVPIAASWQHAVPLGEHAAIRFVAETHDQAQHAWEQVAMLAENREAQEVTLVAADPSLEHEIAQHGDSLDCPVHLASGVAVQASHAATLLRDVRTFTADASLDGLGTLVRHPWIERWLCAQIGAHDECWLVELDRLAAERSVGDIDRFLAASPAAGDMEIIAHVRAQLAGALGELDPRSATSPMSIRRWISAARTLFETVLDGQQLDPRSPADAASIEALRTIGAGCEEAAELEGLGDLDASAALTLVHELCDGVAQRDVGGPSTVEVVGWLEALLDPAPVCVALGLNEGVVPPAVAPDPLIAADVGAVLGLDDLAAARLARDTYLLYTLARSRTLAVVCGKRKADGSPMLPSRLVLRGPRVAERTRLASEALSGRPSFRDLSRASRFGRWRSEPVPISTMSVSAFGDYLRSPRLYYLKHVLKLHELSEPGIQLNASSFGVLVHDALAAFARSSAKDSTSAMDIREVLNELVMTVARDRFGPSPRVAVRVQIEIARRRLGWFARKQAERRAAGWRIVHAEEDVKGASLIVDGLPMGLTGRIDRIDRHDDGRVAVLDYKTSSEAVSPERAHRNKHGWTNLQLPLYRHLVQRLGLEPPHELGYVTLGRDIGATGVAIAPWTTDDLASADAEAERVVRAVRDGDFDDPGKGAWDNTSTQAWAIGTDDAAGMQTGSENGSGGRA